MNHSLITQLMLYFAKFPQREGVLKIFNKGSSNIAGYSDLRRSVNQLAVHSLLPIDDYVFGANLNAVRTRVTSIHSNYLFVDFGDIDFDRDRFSRESDTMSLAVSVGTKLKDFSSDLVEQALAFDHNLVLLNAIRTQMKEDQKTHPWLKDIEVGHTFVPLVAEQLFSVGWTMIFTRKGYESLGPK